MTKQTKEQKIAKIQEKVNGYYKDMGRTDIPSIMPLHANPTVGRQEWGEKTTKKGINATVNVKKRTIKLTNGALNMLEKSPKSVENLVCHEIGHLLMQDDYMRLKIKVPKWERVLHALKELRADVIGVQLLYLSGTSMTKENKYELTKHLEINDVLNKQSYYPLRTERIEIPLKYKNHLLSSALRDNFEVFLERYDITRAEFETYLQKKISRVQQGIGLKENFDRAYKQGAYNYYCMWYNILFNAGITKWDSYYSVASKRIAHYQPKDVKSEEQVKRERLNQSELKEAQQRYKQKFKI